MPYLSDGTDISRMTCDQIEAAQRKADQEFFAARRALSPNFAGNELARLERLRETIAARFLLAMFVAGLLYGTFVSSMGFVIALFGFVGFTITCLVSGNREYNRATRK